MTDRSPRPEPQWLFRRIFTWALTILACVGVGFIIALAPRSDLQLIALFLVGLVGLLATLYLIAPSAPELAAIFRELRGRLQIGGGPGSSCDGPRAGAIANEREPE